jgi:hypothetical protein
MKLWRSHFQYKKPVKHHGPESVNNNYFAPFFPPVPSESGSVISRDLVIYLAHNMNHLMQGFTNIANSLSVWLAPVTPSYFEETGWLNRINESNKSSAAADGNGNTIIN